MRKVPNLDNGCNIEPTQVQYVHDYSDTEPVLVQNSEHILTMDKLIIIVIKIFTMTIHKNTETRYLNTKILINKQVYIIYI